MKRKSSSKEKPTKIEPTPEKPKFSVDKIIKSLLIVRGQKPGKNITLLQEDIITLCQKAKTIFSDQPMLIELEAPLKICGNGKSLYICNFQGDIHG